MRDYEHLRSRVDDSNSRGRRRSPSHTFFTQNDDTEDSDEDDVQIFAHDLSLPRRPHSSQGMHIDSDRCSSPAQSDSQVSFAHTSSETDTFGSSSASSLMGGSSPPSSRSEKALAALGLAMANGAGSLNDYEALVAFQSNNALGGDFNDNAGELWH